MEKEQKLERLRSFRLSVNADYLLRKHAKKRGDVKERILSAISNVDLTSLNCEDFSRKKGRKSRLSQEEKIDYFPTTIIMKDERYEQLRHIAREKDTSVNILVDRAILSYYRASNDE